MDLPIQFHSLLEKPTAAVKEFLSNNPVLYKIALLINHLFRAVSMGFFMLALLFSAPLNLALCFSASLFYRLTVEGNCAYKFALPSFVGASSFLYAQPALADVISKTAFSNLSAFAATLGSLLPLACYFTYIVITVDHEVDKNCSKTRCCGKQIQI